MRLVTRAPPLLGAIGILDTGSGTKDGNSASASDFFIATTAEEFQQAVTAGAKHILLTQHLNMFNWTLEQHGPDRESEPVGLAVLKVSLSTRSIVGNCSEAQPPPASWRMSEPLPAGACAVLLRGSFLDMRAGHPHLWLDRLYLATAPSPTSGLADAAAISDPQPLLIRQRDGSLWITNSVFQGGMPNFRAIDLSAAHGANASLYIYRTTFRGFEAAAAPALRVRSGTCVTAEWCRFADLSVMPSAMPAGGEGAAGSAISAWNGSGVLLVDVSIEGNTVAGAAAGARAVGLWGDAHLYSSPGILGWRVPVGAAEGSPVPSAPVANSSKFSGRFLEAGVILRGIQSEQSLLVAEQYPPYIIPPPAAQAGQGPMHEQDAAAAAAAGAPTGAFANMGIGAGVSQAEAGAQMHEGDAEKKSVNVGLLLGCMVGVAVAAAAGAALVINAALRRQRAQHTQQRRQQAGVIPLHAEDRPGSDSDLGSTAELSERISSECENGNVQV
eukprot:jgi/Ulvmu1/10418/UM062_0014.1